MNTEMQKKNETTPARASEAEPRFVVRPRVDVFENDAEYLVVADLPGVPKDALELRFEDGELRITGRRAPRQNGARSVAEEQRLADYERAFAMPDGIDADGISADLAAGVLRVRLPKAADKRSRKIAVRAG